MVQPSISTTSVSQGSDQSLGDDGTDFTGSSTHTVGGRTISRREDFTRNDESRGVGTEILEEIAETVKSKQSPRRDFVETETDNTEENSKHGETTDLDRFAANGIDGSNGNPIAGNETGARQNQVANTSIVQSM